MRSDARGFLWFCTADGLVRFDGHAAVTFGRDEGLGPAGIRSFLNASDGRYWVGADTGLFEFRVAADERARRFRAVPRDDGQRTAGVNVLLEGRDRAIWCGSGQGLFRLAPGTRGDRLVPVDVGLPHAPESTETVRPLVEDEPRARQDKARSTSYSMGTLAPSSFSAFPTEQLLLTTQVFGSGVPQLDKDRFLLL